MTNHPDETATGAAKIAFSWLLYFVGSITLQDIALFLAIVYSLLQIYVLWRDRVRHPAPHPTTLMHHDDEQP